MDKAFFTILAAVLLGATIMPRPLKAQDNAGGNEVKNKLSEAQAFIDQLQLLLNLKPVVK